MGLAYRGKFYSQVNVIKPIKNLISKKIKSSESRMKNKYYWLDLALIMLAMSLLWLVLGYVMLEIGKMSLDQIVIGLIWTMGLLIGVFATASSLAVISHLKKNQKKLY